MSLAVEMSSRTGQRGTSVATSQRKHRSRSTPRYDLEKKPKKKDLKTTGTTSLVSIPNSIKLTMLNSGLISFVKDTIEAPLHECTRKATVREGFEGLKSEPKHPDDNHDQSVKTVTTKKKKKKNLVVDCGLSIFSLWEETRAL
ncbi:jg9084 [Pararge aegeria aegeria]|uniref:Jg9084 protein n=1 Tax=Pararge aegeria aegeria TaxID=348720 RepID=A0A8S4S222_9NEOP|nr:jg9084 [Pararge aegeria aegeria]